MPPRVFGPLGPKTLRGQLFRASKNWALQIHVAKDNSILGDEPALGRVSPNALQVMPESFSNSPVTNRLIRGYRLKESFPLEMGLENKSVESRGI